MAARQGLAAAAGMKRKRDAVDGEGSGSGSEQSSQVSPMMTMVVEPPTLKPLQDLVNVCRTLLNGTNPPTNSAIYFILGVMDKVGMFDVGLMDEIRFFHRGNMGPQNSPVLTYKRIYQYANKFMVSVIYLPTGEVMPLHDHPGTTVLTKLLAGSARIQAYDWAQPRVSTADLGSVMLAEKVRDDHLNARSENSWVQFPNSKGSLNRFVAGHDGPCVFLKVFTPLYSAAEQQQRCFIYECFPYKFDLNVRANEVMTEEENRNVGS